MKFLFIPSCDISQKNKLEDTRTLRRLVKGLRLWKTGRFDKIIVSGGIHSQNQTTASAVLMKIWLMNNEVESNDIIVEQRSLDTFQNIFFSIEMLEKVDSCPEITVVTHWQHCLRFKMTFWRKYGLKIKTAPIWDFINLKTFILEWIFLFAHLVDKDGQNRFSKDERDKRAR